MKNTYQDRSRRKHSLIRKARDVLDLSPAIKQLFLRMSFITFLFEIAKIIPPILYKEILDRLVAYDPTVGFTPEFILALFIGYGLSLFTMTIVDVLSSKISDPGIRDAEVDILTRTFRKLLALDTTYHERHNTGENINKLLRGQSKVTELLYNAMLTLLPVTFQAIITAFTLLWFSWYIGTVFLLYIPIFFLILAWGARETQLIREEYHQHHDAYASCVAQSVVNVRTVKDFHNEEREVHRAGAHLSRYAESLSRRIRLGLRIRLVEDVLLDIARICTFGLAIWLMVRGDITAGTLVLVTTLSEKAYINLRRIYRTYYQIQDTEPSVERFHDILNHPLRIADNPSSTHRVSKGMVEFRDVTFRYDEREHALSRVSFTLRPRSTVALVGRSGSGKSTVVKLILRQFDPTSGAVLVDGVRADAYALKELRAGIAVVSQDVELFDETVAGNIAYGAPDASRLAIIKAAKLAHAHDFIVELPHGYDTVVGERGIRLSGGQKQRVAIARALLKRPKILIFDEATSSLDAESERRIHEAIVGLGGKLTLILIAHRFATIESADHIVLLEKGEVREQGTREQLLRKKGIFAKLRKLQELE